MTSDVRRGPRYGVFTVGRSATDWEPEPGLYIPELRSDDERLAAFTAEITRWEPQ